MDLKDLNNLDISDIDFNNMGSWPLAAKVFVSLIVFGIVAGLGNHLFVSDQTTQLETLERKEIEFKKEFERKQAKAVNLEAYKSQMVTIQESFKTLLQQLPKSSEIAGLVDELSYAATGAGCEILKVDFLDEVDSEFYAEKPILMQVSGGYHQIAQFVSRVSRLPRIVTLHDFDIKLEGGDVPTSPGEKMLLMSITAKTYRSDTEE